MRVRVRVCIQGNTTLICVVERFSLSGESAPEQEISLPTNTLILYLSSYTHICEEALTSCCPSLLVKAVIPFCHHVWSHSRHGGLTLTYLSHAYDPATQAKLSKWYVFEDIYFDFT